MRPLEERVRSAPAALPDELRNLLSDPHPEVILNAILNRNFTEEMAISVSKRRGIPAEALVFLSGDVRFKDSYRLKLAICKNPKTPQRVVLSLLKFLRVFDLCDITKDNTIHISIRQKIENIMSERIPAMPVGVKTALAKRANANILLLLMERGEEKVIAACLESPALTEGHIYKLINRPSSKAIVIRTIAENKKWSIRYSVRFALIRNFHTPMERVIEFIRGMKSSDLRDIYGDPKLPTSTKPFIFSELLGRGETVETPEDEVYGLSEDEDAQLPRGPGPGF